MVYFCTPNCLMTLLTRDTHDHSSYFTPSDGRERPPHWHDGSRPLMLPLWCMSEVISVQTCDRFGCRRLAVTGLFRS